MFQQAKVRTDLGRAHRQEGAGDVGGRSSRRSPSPLGRGLRPGSLPAALRQAPDSPSDGSRLAQKASHGVAEGGTALAAAQGLCCPPDISKNDLEKSQLHYIACSSFAQTAMANCEPNPSTT